MGPKWIKLILLIVSLIAMYFIYINKNYTDTTVTPEVNKSRKQKFLFSSFILICCILIILYTFLKTKRNNKPFEPEKDTEVDTPIVTFNPLFTKRQQEKEQEQEKREKLKEHYVQHPEDEPQYVMF